MITMSAAQLERHGSLMLDPGTAAAIPGWPAPRPTVYRARALLVPGDLLSQPAFRIAADGALARVGMRLIVPGPDDGDGALDQAVRPDFLAKIHRLAVLGPAVPEKGRAAVPAVIDAWVALQALRASAVAREYDALDELAVLGIGLDHLLVGSAITGSPASEGGGIDGSPASEGGGITGPGSTDSYMFGTDARTPVAVCLPAPERTPAGECPSAFGRRPVIAVLDTGARAHPWLGIHVNPSGLADPADKYLAAPDGFVQVDQLLQTAICSPSAQAAAAGDRPRQLVRYPWDTPVTADPLMGELDSDTGHGTFIAGLVRQIAPDATVLAVRIMHSDGIVYESDLTCALSLLAARVAIAATTGDMEGMVDVVSLSLGYFSESQLDVAYSSALWQVIVQLLGMGVVVACAAGNFATSRRFYPAAFAARPGPADNVPILSVGARNPDRSQALFSNAGSWVTAWAPGAAVVSTFPTDINGSRMPEIIAETHGENHMAPGPTPPRGRESLDPDDYASGWAVWSGTSFSAPLIAAHIGQALLDGAANSATGLRLDVPGAQAAADRVLMALNSLGWPG